MRIMDSSKHNMAFAKYHRISPLICVSVVFEAFSLLAGIVIIKLHHSKLPPVYVRYQDFLQPMPSFEYSSS